MLQLVQCGVCNRNAVFLVQYNWYVAVSAVFLTGTVRCSVSAMQCL